jgi:hypothetical protein
MGLAFARTSLVSVRKPTDRFFELKFHFTKDIGKL